MKRILFCGLTVLAATAWTNVYAEASTEAPTRFSDGRAVDTTEFVKSVSEGPTRFSDGRASEGPTRFNDGQVSEGPTRFNDGHLVQPAK